MPRPRSSPEPYLTSGLRTLVVWGMSGADLLGSKRLGAASLIAIGVALLFGAFPCFADTYPDAITGAWGGRAAYFGDDNPSQAQKACHSFRNPNVNEPSGDVLVFLGSKKFSYGGYTDYIDGNVSVKQIAQNDWLIIDRHYDDGEGSRKPGYKNDNYELQLNGDLLIMKEGKDTSRFSRCPVQMRPQPASMPGWNKQLVELLTRSKRYPPDALNKHESGVVIVSIVLDRSGRLIDSQIKQSSGSVLLDKESLDVLNRAQPFAPLPREYAQPKISLYQSSD